MSLANGTAQTIVFVESVVGVVKVKSVSFQWNLSQNPALEAFPVQRVGPR